MGSNIVECEENCQRKKGTGGEQTFERNCAFMTSRFILFGVHMMAASVPAEWRGWMERTRSNCQRNACFTESPHRSRLGSFPFRWSVTMRLWRGSAHRWHHRGKCPATEAGTGGDEFSARPEIEGLNVDLVDNLAALFEKELLTSSRRWAVKPWKRRESIGVHHG